MISINSHNIHARKKSNFNFKTNKEPSGKFKDKPEIYLNDMTPTEKKIMNRLLSFNINGYVCYISQSKLAAEFGVCRQYVNKCIKRLESLGLIENVYRHMHTSIYMTSPWFENKKRYRLLSKYFAVFFKLMVFLPPLLASASIPTQNHKATQAKYNNSYIYNSQYNFEDKHEEKPQTRKIESVANELRPRTWDFVKKLEGKKRVYVPRESLVMEARDLVNNPLILEAEQLLGLSNHGKAKLAAFLVDEGKSLKHALAVFRTCKGPIDNPYYFVKSIIEKIYVKNNLRPDFHSYFLLKEDNYFNPSESETNASRLIVPSKVAQKVPAAQPTYRYAYSNTDPGIKKEIQPDQELYDALTIYSETDKFKKLSVEFEQKPILEQLKVLRLKLGI